jgi:hypothetical protein
VTVNTGTGDGTITLGLASGGDRLRRGGNNVPARRPSRPRRRIDKSVPQVLAIVAPAGPTNVTTYDRTGPVLQAVTGVDAGDFDLTGTGTARGGHRFGR